MNFKGVQRYNNLHLNKRDWQKYFACFNNELNFVFRVPENEKNSTN